MVRSDTQRRLPALTMTLRCRLKIVRAAQTKAHVRNLPVFYAVALIQYDGLNTPHLTCVGAETYLRRIVGLRNVKVCQNKTLRWTVIHTFTSKDTETET
jgi:hypothetical protein